MALISLAGISAAIDNLDLNESTLKGRLLHAIRERFPDEESLDSVTAIDPLELIEELWAPKTASDIKAKRKNLSSLKSAINKSLKEGIESGANPEGIIIGRDNVFIISEEKKNLLLDKFAMDGDGGHSLLGALAAINDLLADIVTPTDQSEALKILEHLDSTRATLAKLAGLSEADISDKKAPEDEADDLTMVEEFEVDDDTIIEFIEEDDIPGSEGGDDLQYPGAPLASSEQEAVPVDKATGHVSGADDSTEEQGGGEDLRGDRLAEADLAAIDDEDDWDSFEVIDDDFDIIDDEELPGLAELGEADSEPVADEHDTIDLEEVDVDAAMEIGAEEEMLADEIEEVIDDLAERSAEAEISSALDLEESALEMSGDEADQELSDDWDSYEIMDDDFATFAGEELPIQEDWGGNEELPEADDIEVIEEVDDLPTSATAMEPECEVGAEDEILIDEDEEVAEEDHEELPAYSSPAGTTGTSTLEDRGDESAEGQGEERQQANDEWDSFEAEDEDLDFDQPAGDQADQENGPASSGLQRSMDLSQYIEAEEALVNIPDILQEQNDEYVRQILERFMPKFIKIPAGVYPVGGPKRRRTDRAAGKVTLSEFYIGQLPITNDLFDFFVRETGYETEAEQQGHGLVTTGRLRSGLQGETGRHTLAIGKGVISRQIRGANWRHPDGPGSSLENRGHHPVVQISRLDALAFAAWAGKRLPSEDEWEAAARGQAGLLFPWGNDFLPLANLEGQQTGTTTPVNYFGRQSLSPFGLLDMVGNVFEWTSSSYASPNGKELAILKGGSWATAHITCAERLVEPPTTWSNTIGFRCAVDAD